MDLVAKFKDWGKKFEDWRSNRAPAQESPAEVQPDASDAHSIAGSNSTDAMDDWDRNKERDSARQHNSSLDFAATDEEATSRFRVTRSTDPFPDVPPALLNSADIADYVARTGMIYPFNPDRLKTASYEIAALGRYIYIDANGQRIEGELKRGQSLTLPKNSIAFLTTEPFLRLPDYIALRHNLKIDHVYKGLLVGTGPLIDPGFVGRISLPLHNLTEHNYTLVGGQGIIWVEVTKLSPNPAWGAIPRTPDRARYVNFRADRTRDRVVDDYIQQAVGTLGLPSSSSATIARNAAEAKSVAQKAQKDLARNTTWLGITGVAGVIALAVAIFSMIIPMTFKLSELEVRVNDVDTVQSPTPTPSSSPSQTPAPTAPTP
ncbi:dCTP deaminase domain-containing protein [Microbacterium sp. Root180]|uniref:dCTP deaminase domain-containing protein n=1 Tax=Microbacterium sp. Root180 TaxID=1736483 RepID=UPI000AD9F521|nr:hypothetical protein [Microbacterium sp. Root180]